MSWQQIIGIVLMILGALLLLFAPTRKAPQKPAPVPTPANMPREQEAQTPTFFGMDRAAFVAKYDPFWITCGPQLRVEPPSKRYPGGRFLSSCPACSEYFYDNERDAHALAAHGLVRPRRVA
jgi:hypothetical protein